MATQKKVAKKKATSSKPVSRAPAKKAKVSSAPAKRAPAKKVAAAPIDLRAGAGFEAARYTRQLVMPLRKAVSVAEVLLKEAPKELPTPVIKSAHQALSDNLASAQKGLKQRLTVDNLPADAPRVIDDAADALWEALDRRLETYTALPADRFPKVEVAARLRVKLFGKDSLAFLEEDYSEQLQHMSARLDRLKDPQERRLLESVVGEDFVVAIHEIMPAYQAMVEAELRAEASEMEDVNLTKIRRGLVESISLYAVKWVAWAENTATVNAFKTVTNALAPIVNAREPRAKKPKNKPSE